MKKVDAALEKYLNREKQITSCDLYELVLFNGNKYYYADTDIDITCDGKTYKHNALMIKRQQVNLHSRVVVDTMTVTIHADNNDKLEGMSVLKAAHEGRLDRARMYLKRCFFRDRSILGVVSLFGGNVEVKSAGGIKLELSIKAKTQGLNVEFPLRKYYPQGAYVTNENNVVSSTDKSDTVLIAPFIPQKEVLL
ncbi:MAG: DUF2163 domain-containing protein [Dialister sp.]|nr:DUF2163 domain-containing protein [Dialister sp.]